MSINTDGPKIIMHATLVGLDFFENISIRIFETC